jgi:hypothetical protein
MGEGDRIFFVCCHVPCPGSSGGTTICYPHSYACVDMPPKGQRIKQLPLLITIGGRQYLLHPQKDPKEVPHTPQDIEGPLGAQDDCSFEGLPIWVARGGIQGWASLRRIPSSAVDPHTSLYASRVRNTTLQEDVATSPWRGIPSSAVDPHPTLQEDLATSPWRVTSGFFSANEESA